MTSAVAASGHYPMCPTVFPEGKITASKETPDAIGRLMRDTHKGRSCMKTPRGFLPLLLLALVLLPTLAAARASSFKPIYMESIFNQNPAAPPAPGAVPEPQSSRIQVFIFKKGMVLWSQKPGLPQALVPGAPGPRLPLLATDPRLGKIINKYASQQGIDPRLVQTVIRHESGFDPVAVSPKGAMGLMQLMPETAASLGVEDPFDVEQNIKGGVRFLKICLNRFEQNLPLALAAYNAGPGRVVEHQGMPPFKETQDYVKKVVQDYSGQSLDPAQIKLQPVAAVPAVTVTAEAPAAAPPAAASKPLNLLPLFMPAFDMPSGAVIP